MIQRYVSGIGLAGDGLPGWALSKPLLARQALDREHRSDKFSPSILPRNEARRTTPVIKLALQVAAEAWEGCGLEPGEAPTVFASADGDAVVIERICQKMHLPDHPVSPTDFHNSVHNAPGAYWSFCTGSQAASTSIAAGDQSFAVGLLEAAIQPASSVLLVAYDMPLPSPLHERRPLTSPLGIALLLTQEPVANSSARIELRLEPQALAETDCGEALEALRGGVPAGRSLPLLCALAAEESAQIALAYPGGGSLIVEAQPC